MKNIHIRTALITLVFALGAVCARAASIPVQNQEQGSGSASGVEDRLKDLTEKLSLTDDQQAKLRPILEDEQQQLQAKDNSLSPQDRQSRLNRIRVSTNSKIRDLLNDDQKYKFDQMMEKERQERAKQESNNQNN
jgi:hypothetical protein